MRVGVVSDIHCDVTGLALALDAVGDVDELFCPGDIVNEFRFSDEACALLRERDARMVMGNHDEVFLSSMLALRSSVRADRPANLRLLRNLPLTMNTRINGKSLLMAHGSPIGLKWDYIYPHDKRKLAQIGELGYDIVILGHTHYPMMARVGRTLIINPGSCQETRSPVNRELLTCIVLDTQTDEVRLIGVPDPKFPGHATVVARDCRFEEFQ